MLGSNLHILILDDNPRRANRLARQFADWDCEPVILSGDSAVAIAYLADQPVDLVLLNIDTAEKDNFALLRHLQVLEPDLQVPVVITAPPGTAVRRLETAIALGAADTTVRAHNPNLLRARLQNVLQKKLLRDQAGAALASFNEIETIADDLRLVILPIGAALSTEMDYDRLVGRIVEEALGICRADAGVLLLAAEDGCLHYAYARVNSLDLTLGGTSGASAPMPPLPLRDPLTGEPNLTSLSAYVALTGESVNLDDVHTADRFAFPQLMSFEASNSFRAKTCLAVPLRNGQVVGTLVLFNSTDPQTGEIVPFDVYHQQVAESLASQAAVVLNNRQLNEQHTALMRIKREMEIGREIQRSFLPNGVPQPEGWELAAQFLPALEVAGDFYDIIDLPHGHIGFVLADVVGKGITAALFMAIIRSLYRALFQQYYVNVGAGTSTPETSGGYESSARPTMTPFSFVDREALLNAVRLTNAYLINNHGESYVFATLFAGLLHPQTGRLLYVNAGHIPPYVLSPNSASGRSIRERLQPTGPAIGLLPNQRYWVAETVLTPGDLMYAFTDGVTDARNPLGAEFGSARLEQVLAQPVATAETLLAQIQQTLADFCGSAEAYDDITELALRREDIAGS